MGMRRKLRLLASASICAVLPSLAGAAGVEVTTEAAAEGTHGLRVHFGPDCAFVHNLVLDTDDGPLLGTYEACRTISAEAVAVEGAGTTLRAGDQIALGNGFQVEAGSELSVVLDSSLTGGPTYVQDSSPIDENVYTARFSARLDSLVLGAGESIGTLIAYSDAWEAIFRVAIEPATGGGFELFLEALQDGGGVVQTPPGQEIAVPAGWNTVELEWLAGAGDGRLQVAINGGVLAGLVDLDNAATEIETVRWGAVDGALFTSSGSIELDTFSSTR